MVWIMIVSYIAAATITAVAVYTLDDCDPDDLGMVAAHAIFWPMTVVGYATYGIICIPGALRTYKQNRITRKCQEELDHERHQTALAQEHAKQAEANKRELEAFGIPKEWLYPLN